VDEGNLAVKVAENLLNGWERKNVDVGISFGEGRNQRLRHDSVTQELLQENDGSLGAHWRIIA
jgi:hypothetical protein